MYKRIWMLLKNFLYVIILVFFLTIIMSILFKFVVCDNFLQNKSGAKYDIEINNIKYYDIAKKHRYIFPSSISESSNVLEFHYYSYKEEKYEIVLYIAYTYDEYFKEVERLNIDAPNYNYRLENINDCFYYILKRNSNSNLYEYAVADESNYCIFYAYSYGVEKENSTINIKYRL